MQSDPKPGKAPLILYAATGNPGKLAEFAISASSSGSARREKIEVLPLPNLASIPEPIEDADTFMGNAELKARAYSLTAPGLLVFADDSGLAVDALDGAPGVRSARYADDYALAFALPVPTPEPVISTEGALLRRSGETPVFVPAHAFRDSRNNALLLHMMQTQTNRTAHFICAIALARNGQILLRAEGSVEGEILLGPRGTAGFGYDPLFLLPSIGLTMAELPREQKWQLSHRGNAFRSLLSQLTSTEL